MRVTKVAFMALGLASALAMAVPAAHATIADQMTKLTFSRPVQIPGNKVLPAGTYWFQTLDNQALPNAVLIYNENRTRVEATLLTEPAYRAKPQARTELALAGGSRSRAPLLVKWFYPGSDYGHRFLYSARTERQIREEGMRNVLAQPYSG